MNQCFYPDVVSTAQHLTDLAVELAGQGHDVTVVASRRGYDNPELQFAKTEVWQGIRIIRIPTVNLGKKSRWGRAVNFGTFLLSCAARMVFLPGFDTVVALTSPPLISWLAALFVRAKGGRLIFWVMDLNPDEAIAAGWLRENSIMGRISAALLDSSLRQSEKIIALDRFMKRRLLQKGVPPEKVLIISPWSHDSAIRYAPDGREAFRRAHGLSDKYVVMYSGNHSPCHPLDTLLAAARELKEHARIAFCFVGGGSEQQKVRDYALKQKLDNIYCFPYQPLDQASASLSAADLHVVVMGEHFPGILHPCKIYNILALGIPFLYIGPNESHVSDIIAQVSDQQLAKSARHGDVSLVARHILDGASGCHRGALAASGLARNFSRSALLPRLITALELDPQRQELAVHDAGARAQSFVGVSSLGSERAD